MDNNTLPSFIRPFSAFVMIAMVSLLAACGGGGGGGADRTPDAFIFADVVDADLGVEVISAAVTISGINRATAISISGGEYAIGGGAFTSVAGEIENGESVRIRQTSSANVSTEIIATLTVGGVSDGFAVTTFADTTAPTATILFPTPVAFTERDVVTVRGTATDDYSTIASLEVNGVGATSSDGFATWTADDVPLAMGDNSLVVSASDSALNSNTAAASVSLRRGVAGEAFPDNGSIFLSFAPRGIVLDVVNQRLFVSEVNGDVSGIIFVVSLLTGEIEVFSDATTNIPDAMNPILAPAKMALDTTTTPNRLLVADSSVSAIFAVDLIDGSRTILSDNGSAEAPLGEPLDMVIDGARAIVADVLEDAIIEVDLISGLRRYLSNNIDAPDMNEPFDGPLGLTLNASGDRVFVVNDDLAGVIDVALVNGDREIYSDPTFPNSDFPLASSTAIARDPERNRLLVLSEDNVIYSVNTDPTPPLVEGQRAIISDNSIHAGFNTLNAPNDLVVHPNGAIAYIANETGFEIVVMDLENGHRVILSRADIGGGP